MKLDHIGIVVKSIEQTTELYKKLFNFELSSPIIEDRTQKVKIAFISVSKDVRFELIEPIGIDSPVSTFLKKRGGLYHLCYEVEDINKELEKVRKQGSIILSKPVEAAAFNGRKIVFFYTPDKILMEFVEKNER